MYHPRFKGNHYEIGNKWGKLLLGNGKELLANVPFPITEERMEFGRKCHPYYEEFYEDILAEIKGIAEGQEIPAEMLEAVLFSMYCIMPDNKCSCFAFKDKGHIILARNSDFLTEIEKLYMNCMYRFKNGAYSFQGNTTAFVEMEDGVNEHGLAIGLTSVYPSVIGYGLNAGMLLRYGLEKCRTVEAFIQVLKELPIASSQTFTAVDKTGVAAVIECNAKRTAVQYVDDTHFFVSAVNSFHLQGMEEYHVSGIDDWNAEERYETIQNAFRKLQSDGKPDLAERGKSSRKNSTPGYKNTVRCTCPKKAEEITNSIEFAMDVLAGRNGFICQYDRKTGKDTVWSAIYDVSESKVYRCEGNPSRKHFIWDERFPCSL